ncbi:MAG: hypothetical protein MUE33_00790 [Cytophagaceae bacterium]|nr:hypothetical protein [Cytophagaceae bacterium]
MSFWDFLVDHYSDSTSHKEHTQLPFKSWSSSIVCIGILPSPFTIGYVLDVVIRPSYFSFFITPKTQSNIIGFWQPPRIG